jgi:hypothetical protein
MRHFDEAESTRPARVAIHHHRCRGDRSELCERVSQVVGRNLKREVADVQILTHLDAFLAAMGTAKLNTPSASAEVKDSTKSASPAHLGGV